MHKFTFIIFNINRLIFDKYIYNINNLRDIIKWNYIYFNINQKVIFNTLYQTITLNEKDMFFFNKFDNIKKIFLINLILIKIWFDEEIALITIFFDIAIILLNENTTIHSRFKIFINIQFDFTCNILIQNHLIELIHETKLIFWNKAFM